MTFLVGLCIGFSAGFFLSAVFVASRLNDKKQEQAQDQPVISWRVVMDEYGIPATVSMDMTPEGEKLLINSEWADLS